MGIFLWEYNIILLYGTGVYLIFFGATTYPGCKNTSFMRSLKISLKYAEKDGGSGGKSFSWEYNPLLLGTGFYRKFKNGGTVNQYSWLGYDLGLASQGWLNYTILYSDSGL